MTTTPKAAEPIAIVGYAFRLPGGVQHVEALWELLVHKTDLVTQIPSQRWATDELQHPKRGEPGRSVTFAAGALPDIDRFDAEFFGISPREAALLDPQQRLLLELAWEAFENAGVPPSRLAGSDCAVYVGIASLDYGTRGLDDLASMTAHSMTGNTLSVAANRLSYFFDLHGPSLAVDTACSSSLTALHHACEAIRSGQAGAALVGGVSLLLHPYPFVGFTKASMLSAGGRCKVFDASGDGYVRAEGGVVVFLKPLQRALEDGDSIHAVILASGVNADGRRKSALTIPSCDAQSELMRKVLQQAGLTAQEVDYLEAHGTGTAVGDPIECAAIGRVYGQSRQQPLPIGSIKANLGHMEAASGMAGLIKALLVLKHRAVPPQLHLHTPNPKIDFERLRLQPATDLVPLSKSGPLVVGVNSFGFGGANGHVLLQEYRAPETIPAAQAEPDRRPPLILSARSSAALRAQAQRYADWLQSQDCSLGHWYDIAHAAAHRREWLPQRLAIAAPSAGDAIAKLHAYAQGDTVAGVVQEEALPEPGGVAFVYSGNGSQWVGMGRRMLAESAAFARCLAEVDQRMQPVAGFSVLARLQAEDDAAGMDDTTIAQPALFAIQVALTEWLREQGVEPDAVTGHSVGEVAAAWCCGAFDLDTAIRVIVARSRAQGRTRGTGRMAAVGLSAAAIQDVLSEFDSALDVVIAGINSPNNVTLSGALTDLERLQQILQPRGVFFRVLDLDYAFHSPRMDPIEHDLLADLAGLAPAPTGRARYVSTVTGAEMPGDQLGADYWWRNVREPVRFADAMATLATLGCRVFVEIGPHAILQRYMAECLGAASIKGRVLPTLRREADGVEHLTDTALRALLIAKNPNLAAHFPRPGRFVHLPNYPWQRERFWIPTSPESLRAIERRRVHPLLGWPIPEAEHVWENTLDPYVLPWLADHQVGGAIVFPGAAYAEMALAAARQWLGTQCVAFEELDILMPMVFDGEHARTLRFELQTRDGSFLIKSRQRLSDEAWHVHAAGRLLQGEPSVGSPSIPAPEPAARALSRDTHYQLASALGLDYGPAFQGLQSVAVDGDLWQGELSVPEGLPTDGYLVHPALLDVAYQSLVDRFQADIEAGQGVALLPVKVTRFDLLQPGAAQRFRARLRRRSARSVLLDFELLDGDCALLARMTGCRFRAAPPLRKTAPPVAHWEFVPWLMPHPQQGLTTSLPAPGAWIEVLDATLALVAADRQRWFHEALPMFEAMALSFAFEAYHACAEQGRLAELLSSQDPYTRWLNHLLRQEGLLVEVDGSWQLVPAGDLPAAETIWRTLVREDREAMPELVLAARVGRHLAELLLDPSARAGLAQRLTSSFAWDWLFQRDPAYAGVECALQALLHRLVEEVPPNRRLRVLEVAAHPSELARTLLARLPEDRLDYVLVLSPVAAQRLAPDLPEHPNLTVLTWPDDGRLEGLAAEVGAFDLALLHHALHRAPAPRGLLNSVRRRLAGGGLLVVAERHPDWSADFIAGLQSDWWHAAPDQPVPHSALAPPHTWQALLAEEGFDGVLTWTEPAGATVAAGAYLVLGQQPQAQGRGVADLPPVQSWLLICDAASADFADHLRAWLQGYGQQVRVSEALPVPALDEAHHVVVLRGWADGPSEAGQVAADAAALVQSLATQSTNPRVPRLWLVTRGGAVVSNAQAPIDPQPAQAALWGLGRVVMNEYPAFQSTLIDLDIPAETGFEPVSALGQELLWPDGGNEILLTPSGRFVPMFQEARTPAVRAASAAREGERFRLDFHLPGQLRHAVWLPMQAQPLASDAIEVEVQVAGVNFRDVMYLMGLLPDEAVEKGFAGASLGLEFAGIVRRVGEGVQTLRPGQRVMGFGSSCLASHVVTRADAVAPIPDAWSYVDAATVPTVFFTAYYALVHLAQLQAGERVLIHGGAGGVGLAAIQLAKHLGAEVFATAGSDEKRDFVRLLGADHVLDSRSLDFADQILAATGGEGVDVVLNSLAGEAMRRSLAVLKPFGRFLELGKRDFFENTPVGLRPFKDNIAYFGIDADQILVARPKLASRLFAELMALFREGALAPLPALVFPAERVVEALRTMQQARHIGKVVVTLAGAAPVLERPAPPVPPLRLAHESTWLVTGGLTGFGLESARWLAAQGVGCLVLVGRRGLDTPGAPEAIAELAAQRVQVLVESCDITDAAAVRQLIERIRTSCPPLKGVLHAATAYDDALLAQLSPERIHAVMAPKLLGAWHLHQATLDVPLEHFVLYSSVTTALGNPGQANYVAANAALEGLAQWRRQIGLPAVCIGWGPIGDAGVLTRNQAVKDLLAQRLGRPPMSAQQALETLGRLLVEPRSVVVADFDWNTVARVLPSANGSRFAVLNRQRRAADGSEAMQDWRALLAERSPEQAVALVKELVLQELAQVLGIGAERIDPKRPLRDLGLDSLMAVELALGLEQRLGAQLPSMMLSDAPTVEDVARRLVERVQGVSAASDTDTIDATVQVLAQQHGEAASEDDRAQLAQEVARLKQSGAGLNR